MKYQASFFILLFALTACTSNLGKPANNIETASPTREPSSTFIPNPTQTTNPLAVVLPPATSIPTLAPDAWKTFPVYPTQVSMRMIEVYQNGLARGRDPNRFSKFGDCQNVPSFFLTIFDTGNYRLGEQYGALQTTIDHFSGSWGRKSLAVVKGSNVASVQTTYWTDVSVCDKNETPMACEIRLFNPSIVIISFETWWGDKPAAEYETRLRSIVEFVLSQDVVPILATKADNTEGDYSINAAIANVAVSYELPLWNFWAATYPLPDHGLTTDGFHLTFAGDYFDDPVRMQNAWPWRNLTALQTIDAVHRAFNSNP